MTLFAFTRSRTSLNYSYTLGKDSGTVELLNYKLACLSLRDWSVRVCSLNSSALYISLKIS